MRKSCEIADPRFPAFRERAPWRGGDLQTLRNYVLRARVRYPDGVETTRLKLPAGDGDLLWAALDRPALDRRRMGAPLVFLIHGLTGCEDSAYMRIAAAAWLVRGHAVVRFNMRGAGPSRIDCAGHYHAGRAEDIGAALSGLDEDLLTNGVIAAGYSLGGNVLLNFLAKKNEFNIRAAAAISAPIDLAAAAGRMMERRNRLYHNWLLDRMRDEAMAPGAALSDAERAAITGARTIYAYDDRFVAPRHGYGNADRYYAEASSLPRLGAITVPTMLIHAANDPWIPASAHARAAPSGQAVTVLIAPGGGHVGFHGVGSQLPWHERCFAVFVADTLGES